VSEAADPRYPTPPIPAWLAKWNEIGFRSGPLDPEHQVVMKKSDGEIHWTSNKGPQTWTLMCPYDEILIGGRRGGGKSEVAIAWTAVGDNSLSIEDPARYSFLNEPSYRFLLLRHEYQSMSEFVDQATEFYRPFGCKAKDDPVRFEFKSGARGYTGHINDANAFEKYKGHGITRIVIEELSQLPDRDWYLKLMGSLRGKKQFRVWNSDRLTKWWGRPMPTRSFPKLRCQILSSTNPDGPGGPWVKERFVKVRDSHGNLIPENTPMRDQVSKGLRIFIPMRREDCPQLRDDKQYDSMLLNQNEVVRKQWMDGDWDAGAGTYFTEFRPDGPIGEIEQTTCPWARHIVEPVELKPWWYRWGGGDWGFQHPALWHKACRNEKDGRIHIYDEKSFRQVGSFEMGIELAKWWLAELEEMPEKTVQVALSPDAFSKVDASRTKAEQISDGIKTVLGPYGAFLLRYSDEERAAMAQNPKLAAQMFERRRMENSKGQFCIALKSANTDRVAGWNYMHELLRFRPVLQETEEELKGRLVRIFTRAGIEAYERELAKVRTREKEVLPRLVIWRHCYELKRFLEVAQHDGTLVNGIAPRTEDVKKFDANELGDGGDDAGDSARHLLMAFKEVEKAMPKSHWMSEQMSKIQSEQVEVFGAEITDPTRLSMIAATQSARFDSKNVGLRGYTPPRASSSRHRPNRVH
jgi:hypothetical protein